MGSRPIGSRNPRQPITAADTSDGSTTGERSTNATPSARPSATRSAISMPNRVLPQPPDPPNLSSPNPAPPPPLPAPPRPPQRHEPAITHQPRELADLGLAANEPCQLRWHS